MPSSLTYEIINGVSGSMDLDLSQGEYLKISIHGFINNPDLLPTGHPNYNSNLDIKNKYASNPEIFFEDEKFQDRLEVISHFNDLNNLDTTAQLIIKANKNLIGLQEVNDNDYVYYLQFAARSSVIENYNFKVVITKYAADETEEIEKLLKTSYENDQDATKDIYTQASMETDGGTFLGNFGDSITKNGTKKTSETPITNYDTKVRLDQDNVAVFLEVGHTYTFKLINKSHFLSDKQFFSKVNFNNLVYKSDGSLLESAAFEIIGNQLKITVLESGQYFIQAEALLDNYIAKVDQDGQAVQDENYFGPIAYGIESTKEKIDESENEPTDSINQNTQIITKGTTITGNIDYFGDKDSFTFNIQQEGLYFIELSEESEKYTNILGIQAKLLEDREDISLIHNINNYYFLQKGTYNLLLQGFVKDKEYEFKISKAEISTTKSIKSLENSKEIISRFADNQKADFIKVSVEAGKGYVFILSKEDPYDNIDLRILGLFKNPNSEIAQMQISDDDSAGNSDAKIYFLASATQDLYIKIAATNNYGKSAYHARLDQTKLEAEQFSKYQEHINNTPFTLDEDKLSDQENKKDSINYKIINHNNPIDISLAANQKGIVEISLDAGSWTFETLAKSGNMVDTIIYGIYDQDGNYIKNTFDDNSGYDFLSKVRLEINQSGKYFVHVGSNSDSETRFDLKVSDSEPTPKNSGSNFFSLKENSDHQIIEANLTKDTTYKFTISDYDGNQTPLENFAILGLYYGSDTSFGGKNLTLIPTTTLFANNNNKLVFYFTTSDILPYINSLDTNYFVDGKLFIKIGSYQQNYGDYKVVVEKVDKPPTNPNSFFDSINGEVKDQTNFHGVDIQFIKPTNTYNVKEFDHWKKIIANTLDSMWESKNGRNEIKLLSESGKKVTFNFEDGNDQAYFSGEISISYKTLTEGFIYAARDPNIFLSQSDNNPSGFPYTKEAMMRVIVHELLHVAREWGDPPPGQYNKHLEVTNRIIREINGDDPNSEQGYDRIAYPIIFDLNNNGIADLVEKSNSNLKFDMNNDGKSERTGWTKPIYGTADGILVWDINQNNKIDNILEISFSRFAPQKKSDLLGLKFFDKNNDWLIDKQDKIYHKLQIWQDNNHNGISEKNELFSLAELNINSINLKYTNLDHSRDISQNQITKQASFNTTDNETENVFKVWDVGFSFFG